MEIQDLQLSRYLFRLRWKRETCGILPAVDLYGGVTASGRHARRGVGQPSKFNSRSNQVPLNDSLTQLPGQRYSERDMDCLDWGGLITVWY